MSQRSDRRTNQLHKLIKSLSKSEKRFFKIFSKRHVIGERNNYVQLFDAIESQEKYDEKAIAERFQDEKFAKRLAVAKGYLYELILKSMNQYHAQNGIHNQIIEYTRQVSFLFDKSLFDQAHRLLRKAVKIAQEYEKVSILPELLFWHKKIMEAQFYSGQKIENIEALYEQEKDILADIANLNEYWILQAKLYYQHNLKGIIRNSEDLVKIEDIYNSTLMKKEEQAKTFRAKILFNKIYSTYFFILRDFDSCYRYIKRMVSLFEDKRQFIEEYPLDYIQGVNNLLNVTQVLKKPQETLAGLENLKKMMSDVPFRGKQKVQLKLFESYFYNMLTFNLEKDDFQSGYAFVPEIEKGFKKFAGKMNKMGELMLHYHLFQTCFGARKFKEAKKWVLKIIDRQGSDIRQDILSFSHILNLMVDFELGQELKMRKTIDSTLSYLKQNKSTYKFESIIADYLSNLPASYEEVDLQDSFAELRTRLQKLTKDPFEKKAFAYFDFLGWLDKKIQHNKEIVVD